MTLPLNVCNDIAIITADIVEDRRKHTRRMVAILLFRKYMAYILI